VPTACRARRVARQQGVQECDPVRFERHAAKDVMSADAPTRGERNYPSGSFTPTGARRSVHFMTPPQDKQPDRTEPTAAPFAGLDAARQVAYVTGMDANAAQTYAAFLSGLRSFGPATRRAA
jgi:hypothetical protein